MAHCTHCGQALPADQAVKPESDEPLPEPDPDYETDPLAYEEVRSLTAAQKRQPAQTLVQIDRMIAAKLAEIDDMERWIEWGWRGWAWEWGPMLDFLRHDVRVLRLQKGQLTRQARDRAA